MMFTRPLDAVGYRLSFNQDGTVMHRYGLERAEKKLPHITGNEVQILMKNDRRIVTFSNLRYQVLP
ncbi:hypothetical protein [Pectobacterium sp. B2J-2]|uniref:hypothetical protein n=1 Tax=Pectobacterium sp. B2J-2 TaxID=3385372 RepID=UPI0038FCE817